MGSKINCPKCIVGELELLVETMDDLPENECNICKTRFHIYVEYEDKQEKKGKLIFEEIKGSGLIKQ